MKKHFKKISIRSIAVLLSIVLSVMSFPLSVFAIEGTPESDVSFSKSVEKDVIELIDERTATTKRFRLEDGSYMVAQYDTAVHYQDENGAWQNIDNTLAVSGNEITTSDAKIKFAKKTNGSETLFALHDGNRKLTLRLEGASKKVSGKITNDQTELGEDATKLEKMTTLDKISASVLYVDILPNTDLEYVIKGNNIKENIIVKAKQDTYSYTFTLSLNNLTATLNAQNELEICDANSGNVAYRIPAPVMWDANDALSDNIAVSLTDLGNGDYTLTLTPSAEWINDDARALPVIVDPPIYTNSSSSVLDFYVSPTLSASSTVNSSYMLVGESHRAYWKLSALPTLPASAYITNATLTTKVLAGADASGIIGVYDALVSLTNTATWQTTTNNISENYTDYNGFVEDTVDTSLNWNVTPIVKKWYAGQNYGLAFAPIDSFFSGSINLKSNDNTVVSVRPVLSVEYVDMKGLENYWSYTSQSAGFAGSGSINHATGNLVFAIPTLTTTDALMPFTPTLVYNSALANKQYAYSNAQTAYAASSSAAVSVPLGFKLNIQETLLCKTYTDQNNEEKQLYILADSDGTEHYFLPTETEGVFSDEDGLMLELTVAASSITLKDSSDNVRTFSRLSTQPSGTSSAWYLTSVSDKVGNKLIFAFDSSYRPIAIKLDPVTVAPIEQMRLWYNTNGKLGAVYNPASKEAVILRYSGNYLSQLLRVHTSSTETINDSFWSAFYSTYPSSYNTTKYIVDAVATYSFNTSGYLTSVENGLTSYRLSYEYDSASHKVTSIAESAASENSTTYLTGQSIRLSYGAESAVIRTSGKDDVLMTSDDLLTTYGFDYYGRSVSCYTTNLDQTVLYGASNGQYVGEENENAKNNLKSSVQTVQHSSNYLLNGGFERASGTSGAEHWNTTGNVSRVETMGFNESYALQLWIGGSVSYSEARQEVYLPAGQYTLSAQVKTQNAQDAFVGLFVEGYYEITIPKNEQNVTNNYTTIEVDVYLETSTNYTVGFYLAGQGVSTSVYFDQVMLSRTTGASEYDMISGGHFESPSWDSDSALSMWNSNSTDPWVSIVDSSEEFNLTTSETFFGDVLKMYGEAYSISQVVYETTEENKEMYDAGYVYSNPTRVLTVSGWGKGTAQCYSSSAKFAIQVDILYYRSGTSTLETYIFDFSKDITDWQFLSGGFATNPAKGLLEKITVKVLYTEHPGVGYFDNIALIENSSTTNAYDYTSAGYLSSYKNGSNWTYYYYDEDNEDESKRDNIELEISSNKSIIESYYDEQNLPSITHYQKYTGVFNPATGTITGGGPTGLYYYLYSYDDNGLLSSQYLFDQTGDSAEPHICSTFNYARIAGSHIFGVKTSETDSLNNTTRYFYDESNGRLKAVAYPNGNGVYYEYDGMGNLDAVYPATLSSNSLTSYTYDTSGTAVGYVYDSVTNRLDTVYTQSTEYHFVYDSFGNSSAIEIGDRTLASYEYKTVYNESLGKNVPVNGKLDTLTYGNGLEVKYLYDSLDRVEGICYNIGTNGRFVTVYSYKYDSNGRLYSVTDHRNNECTRYTYDFNGNLLQTYTADTSTDQIKVTETYQYDDQSRLNMVMQQMQYPSGSGSGLVPLNYYTNIYDQTTGRLSTYMINTRGLDATVAFTYDDLGRATQKAVSGTSFYNTYSYDYKTYNTLQESTLVSSLISQTYAGEGGDPIWGTVYYYTYDANGNITEIRDVSNVIQYRYQYDNLGQLTREDNRQLNKSYVWEYDDAGNILSKTTYAFTTGTLGTATDTVTYGYDDAFWGDLLTYDGYFTIRYDEVGNPKNLLEYEEDDFVVGILLEWEGRQLVGYHYGEGYSGEIDTYSQGMTFTYNADGIRIGKNVYGTEYEYIVSGSQILAEKWTSGGVEHFLQYVYDESGSPIGLNYRTNAYAANVFDVFYFEKNLQGDIVAVYNDSGTRIGTYTYDAWGNFTVSTTSGITTVENNIVRNYNPFRYRGYYYDDDLGMYYLQSRYYNPAWGRFLNADDSAVLTATPDALTDKNLYAYCDNNPIMRVDEDGEFWNIVAGAAVGAAFTLVTELIDNQGKMTAASWAKVGISALEGGLTAAVGPVAGALISAGASIATDLIDGERDFSKIALNAVGSLAVSGVSSGVEFLGRAAAVKKLEKSSAAQIKRFVTSIDGSITGKMRNEIKNPKNWSKDLRKKVFDNIFSPKTSILVGNGIGITFSTANYLASKN